MLTRLFSSKNICRKQGNACMIRLISMLLFIFLSNLQCLHHDRLISISVLSELQGSPDFLSVSDDSMKFI